MLHRFASIILDECMLPADVGTFRSRHCLISGRGRALLAPPLMPMAQAHYRIGLVDSG